MRRTTLLVFTTLTTLCATPNALACSQLPAETGFIMSNDRNRDGNISQREWQNAQIGNHFVAFRLGDGREFARLDLNRNRKLDANELHDKVRYRRAPCADWEEYSNRVLREQQQNQPQP